MKSGGGMKAYDFVWLLNSKVKARTNTSLKYARQTKYSVRINHVILLLKHNRNTSTKME